MLQRGSPYKVSNVMVKKPLTFGWLWCQSFKVSRALKVVFCVGEAVQVMTNPITNSSEMLSKGWRSKPNPWPFGQAKCWLTKSVKKLIRQAARRISSFASVARGDLNCHRFQWSKWVEVKSAPAFHQVALSQPAHKHQCLLRNGSSLYEAPNH